MPARLTTVEEDICLDALLKKKMYDSQKRVFLEKLPSEKESLPDMKMLEPTSEFVQATPLKKGEYKAHSKLLLETIVELKSLNAKKKLEDSPFGKEPSQSSALMDKPAEKINIKNLLTDELGVNPDYILEGERHLRDFYGDDADGESSLSEEDLQETHKKLTDLVRTNKEVADDFVNLFMNNDP